MSRPLRLEFEGALYHVTSRGDRREPIFEDDADREAWLSVFEQGLERFEATAFAYCLMGNHYHAVIQTLFRRFVFSDINRTRPIFPRVCVKTCDRVKIKSFDDGR